MIKTKQPINEWAALSPVKKCILLGMTGIITGYVVFSSGAQAYSYVESFPETNGFQDRIYPQGWMILSLTISGTVGVYVILSQGLASYKAIRDLLAGKEITFANRFSSITSSVISIPLGLIGGTYNFFSNYSSVSQLFSLSKTPYICVIGTLSLCHAISEISMNGRFRIQSLDKLIRHLSHHYPTASEIAALILSASAAGLLAYGMQPYVEEASKEILLGLFAGGADYINIIASIISYGVVFGDFINDTSTLIQATSAGFDWVGYCFNGLYHRLTRCTPKRSTIEAEEVRKLLEDEETRPLLHDREAGRTPVLRAANNPHLLFSHPNLPEDEPKSKPNQSCWKRASCTLL